MGRWIAVWVIVLWPCAVALADVPSYEPPQSSDTRSSDTRPSDTPAAQTAYEQGYDQGYAFGQALAPLCCGCVLVAGVGATGGLVYFLSRRKKKSA